MALQIDGFPILARITQYISVVAHHIVQCLQRVCGGIQAFSSFTKSQQRRIILICTVVRYRQAVIVIILSGGIRLYSYQLLL